MGLNPVLNDVPLGLLFSVLVALIILSGFFSSSETSMMSLNRYRLKHLQKNKHRGALRAGNVAKWPRPPGADPGRAKVAEPLPIFESPLSKCVALGCRDNIWQ